MKYITLVRLALKVVGVFLFAQGVTSCLSQIGWTLTFSQSSGSASSWWAAIGRLCGSLVEGLFGLYLFFGGRWIVNLAIPSNRPYCTECAYDLTGAPVERCPECGTAFRWEDVKPKTEIQSSKFEN